jgi:hypothetical protein
MTLAITSLNIIPVSFMLCVFNAECREALEKFQGTNSLPYFASVSATEEKRFIILTPGQLISALLPDLSSAGRAGVFGVCFGVGKFFETRKLFPLKFRKKI